MLKESPLYGVPVAVIAERCAVHPDTARRWKRTGNLPIGAQRLLAAVHDHDLGSISPPWAGWCIRDGDLVAPNGERFTPGLVMAGKYHKQRAADLERELRTPRQLSF